MVEVREQAVEGGEVELSCLVPRSRPAAVLRWYRDRKELKGTQGEAGRVEEQGGGGWGGGSGFGKEAGLRVGGAWRVAHRFSRTLSIRCSAVELGVMTHACHPNL